MAIIEVSPSTIGILLHVKIGTPLHAIVSLPLTLTVAG
jgi:hypothetical protein